MVVIGGFLVFTEHGEAALALSLALDEKALTKGELRKLNALRKSLGEEIATEAFAKWLAARVKGVLKDQRDKNADLIADTLTKLLDKGFRTPRGGYSLRRSKEHTSEPQSLMRISYAVLSS